MNTDKSCNQILIPVGGSSCQFSPRRLCTVIVLPLRRNRDAFTLESRRPYGVRPKRHDSCERVA